MQFGRANFTPYSRGYSPVKNNGIRTYSATTLSAYEKRKKRNLLQSREMKLRNVKRIDERLKKE
jgi:uncharacterized protein with von Willebrand factor type A (vWA) domain